jgi:hypothetical protein
MSRVFFFSVVVDAKFGGKVERELQEHLATVLNQWLHEK